MTGVWKLSPILVALSTSPRLETRVYPMVTPANGTVRITCRVPRDADNRSLDIALEPVQVSTRQLDGDQAPITTAMLFDHVPCWAERASCTLHTMGRKDLTTSQSLLVAGCDQ